MTERRFRSRLDEVTDRLEQLEVQKKEDRLDFEEMKKEISELQEKQRQLEQDLKHQDDEKQRDKTDVENRIKNLESKSNSFASKLLIFENLSNQVKSTSIQDTSRRETR